MHSLFDHIFLSRIEAHRWLISYYADFKMSRIIWRLKSLILGVSRMSTLFLVGCIMNTVVQFWHHGFLDGHSLSLTCLWWLQVSGLLSILPKQCCGVCTSRNILVRLGSKNKHTLKIICCQIRPTAFWNVTIPCRKGSTGFDCAFAGRNICFLMLAFYRSFGIPMAIDVYMLSLTELRSMWYLGVQLKFSQRVDG